METDKKKEKLLLFCLRDTFVVLLTTRVFFIRQKRSSLCEFDGIRNNNINININNINNAFQHGSYRVHHHRFEKQRAVKKGRFSL